jgi:hypothetical protein
MSPKQPSMFRHKDFCTFWLSHTATQFGTQVALLGMPLVASLTLAATPLQMGLLGALEYAPFLLIGLFSGVWVDRSRRRPLLFISNIGRALLLAMIPVASFAGILRMEGLYVIAFLTGVCTVIFDIAYQSYLPSLVSRDQLVKGNSQLEGSLPARVSGGRDIGRSVWHADCFDRRSSWTACVRLYPLIHPVIKKKGKVDAGCFAWITRRKAPINVMSISAFCSFASG